jgi:hypothetical protein
VADEGKQGVEPPPEPASRTDRQLLGLGHFTEADMRTLVVTIVGTVIVALITALILGLAFILAKAFTNNLRKGASLGPVLDNFPLLTILTMGLICAVLVTGYLALNGRWIAHETAMRRGSVVAFVLASALLSFVVLIWTGLAAILTK